MDDFRDRIYTDEEIAAHYVFYKNRVPIICDAEFWLYFAHKHNELYNCLIHVLEKRLGAQEKIR